MRALILILVSAVPALADLAVLDAWLVRQQGIRSLETRFTQERRLPALKQPVTSPGRMVFAQPDKVRWELGDPPKTLAISDGRMFTLIDHTEKTMRQIPAGSPQAARFSLLGGDAFRSPHAFRGAFEVVESRVAGGVHQFTLRPRDRRVRTEVPWIFIDIDAKRNVLRAMELELRDRSRVRTVFHNPRFNVRLPEGTFQP
jgi:outer membrane lipoprotein carrier protein